MNIIESSINGPSLEFLMAESWIDQLAELHDLKETGALTQDEFQNEKQKLLSSLGVTLHGEPEQAEAKSPLPPPEIECAPDNKSDWTDYEEQYSEQNFANASKIKMRLIGAFLTLGLIGVAGWFALGPSILAQETTVRVTSVANARDMPTGEDSSIVFKLDAGELLTGEWVDGANDASVKWFETNKDGRTIYVWEGNLIEIERVSSDAPPSAKSAGDHD
jgi:hypothetical protein